MDAAKYFKQLAIQGRAKSQYLHGLSLSKGSGISKNYSKAAKIFKLFADQGNSDAQYRCG
jgi:TPR repeat protein